MKRQAILLNALNEYQEKFIACDKAARDAYNEGKTAAYHSYHRDALKAVAARDALDDIAKRLDYKIFFNPITGRYRIVR